MIRFFATICLAALAAVFFTLGARERAPHRWGYVLSDEVFASDPTVKKLLKIESSSVAARTEAEMSSRAEIPKMDTSANHLDKSIALRKTIFQEFLRGSLDERLAEILSDRRSEIEHALDIEYDATRQRLNIELKTRTDETISFSTREDRYRLINEQLRRDVLARNPLVMSDAQHAALDTDIKQLKERIESARESHVNEIRKDASLRTQRVLDEFQETSNKLKAESAAAADADASKARAENEMITERFASESLKLKLKAGKAMASRTPAAPRPPRALPSPARLSLRETWEDFRIRLCNCARDAAVASDVKVVFDTPIYAAKDVREMTKSCMK
jgi:hypothetical protein